MNSSERKGFSSDALAEKFTAKIAGIKQNIRHKFNYIADYESYLKQNAGKNEDRILAREYAGNQDKDHATSI